MAGRKKSALPAAARRRVERRRQSSSLAASINKKAGVPTAGFFCAAFKVARSSRIQKTNPVEPPRSRNIAHLLSLSVRAMQTDEEIFHDQSLDDVGGRGGADRRNRIRQRTGNRNGTERAVR